MADKMKKILFLFLAVLHSTMAYQLPFGCQPEKVGKYHVTFGRDSMQDCYQVLLDAYHPHIKNDAYDLMKQLIQEAFMIDKHKVIGWYMRDLARGRIHLIYRHFLAAATSGHLKELQIMAEKHLSNQYPWFYTAADAVRFTMATSQISNRKELKAIEEYLTQEGAVRERKMVEQLKRDRDPVYQAEQEEKERKEKETTSSFWRRAKSLIY
jgi:hypothetical protein